MSAKKTDISQISKYLKEELDAHAMHVLEKEAQNDPFLMDAMDGFESAATDPRSAMSDLAKRLEQRINQKQKRVIPWRTMAIAASVLLVLSVGGFFLFNRHADQPTPLIAHIDKAPVVKQTDTVVSIKPEPATTIAAVVKPEPNRIKKRPVVVTEAHPVTAPVVTARDGYTDNNISFGFSDTKANDDRISYQKGLLANARKVDTASLTYKKSIDKNYALAMGSVQPLQQQTLLGKVKGLNFVKPEHKATPQQELEITGRISEKPIPNNLQPVPGVNGMIRGNNGINETDSIHYFAADAAKKSKSINASGFYSAQKTPDKDSVKLAAQQYNASLNEVVVTGYGTQKAPSKVVQEAHPLIGWNDFNAYLKQKAVTDQKTGVVRISFIVSSIGTVSDFNVIKSLDDAADKKAVDLIKTGSKWLGNADGKPEIVELKVRFRKAAPVK